MHVIVRGDPICQINCVREVTWDFSLVVVKEQNYSSSVAQVSALLSLISFKQIPNSVTPVLSYSDIGYDTGNSF